MDSLKHAELWPHLRPAPGRYNSYALAANAVLRALGAATRYRAQIIGVPDVQMAAKGQHHARISVAPGAYLWAIAASSGDAAGFRFQLRDAGTGQEIFTRAVKHSNASGGSAASSQGLYSPLHLLPRPYLVIDPGVIVAQIENAADGANDVQLVLFFAYPEEA